MTPIYKIITVLSISFFIVITFSCDNKTENDLPKSEIKSIAIDSTKITSKEINQIKYTEYALSDITQNKTANWVKFNELSKIIELLKTGDLSFFRDDKAILVGFLTDLKNEVPESLNNSAILVRLTVIETVFLKLEGLASLSSAKKPDLLASVKDVLISHSNLIFQINKKFEKDSQEIEKPN